MKVFTQFNEASLHTLWESAVKQEPKHWPFFTLAWHQAWYTHFGTDEQLMIVGDETNRTVLPLSISGTTAHFTGGEEIADYLDAIGPGTHKGALWQETMPLLMARGVTRLMLRNIPQPSESLTYFRSISATTVTEEDATPLLALPKSFDDYLTTLSRKQRHEMRRKLRRFDEQYPGVTFVAGDQPDIKLLLTLMRNNDKKQEFLTPAMEGFFFALPQTAGGQLKQFTLIIDNKPIATTVAFEVGRSLLLYNSGYDPSVEGSGWYLKSKCIRWAIDNGYTQINFLQGKERYKYDLGAGDFLVYRVSLTL